MKRRSPVRHKVSGYTRRNGKHIEGYWRGRGTKGRQSRVVGGSIPIVTARGYVKETVEKYGGYSMTEFDKDETAFLPKNKIGLVREILEKEGFSFYPESGYGEIDSEDLERFDVELDVLGHKWRLSRPGVPIKVPEREILQRWGQIHIHAPARKELSWYDRGWDYPMDFRKSMK